ncbi:MAG: hypothetical protein IJD93_00030 [Ruminococcus sp.]|nr:hypothetical protein [Ruminococcus sp.]
MKKFSKIILPLMLTVVLVCLSMVNTFAAEVLTVNGKEAAVGSEVTYTFSIGAAQQRICGIHMVIFFDQDLLSLKEVNTDNLGGGTIVNDNKGNNGRIIVTNSFVNGTSGLDCKESKDIVTVTFEVIKEGTTDITYYMPYLYDIDSVNIYDYTFTCDLAVDGQAVIEDVAPPLEDVAQLQDFGDAGDFENNEAGTGSGEKPVAPSVQNTPQGSSQGSEGKGEGSGIVIPIVCASVILVAIIVLVVVKSVTSKKSDNDGEQ